MTEDPGTGAPLETSDVEPSENELREREADAADDPSGAGGEAAYPAPELEPDAEDEEPAEPAEPDEEMPADPFRDPTGDRPIGHLSEGMELDGAAGIVRPIYGRIWCPACAGQATIHSETPAQDPNADRCPTCDGYGKVLTGSRIAENAARVCPTCTGRGFIDRLAAPALARVNGDTGELEQAPDWATRPV